MMLFLIYFILFFKSLKNKFLLFNIESDIININFILKNRFQCKIIYFLFLIIFMEIIIISSFKKVKAI